MLFNFILNLFANRGLGKHQNLPSPLHFCSDTRRSSQVNNPKKDVADTRLAKNLAIRLWIDNNLNENCSH